MEPNRTNHLIYIETMPENVIKINEYGRHKFDNLFYNPENDELYQQYKNRIRLIAQSPKRKALLVRSNQKETVYISLRKLKNILKVEK